MAVVAVRARVAEEELSARLDLTVPGRLEVVPGDPVVALTITVEVVVRFDQALIEPRSIAAAINTDYRSSIGRTKAIFPENKDYRGNLITPFSSCFSKSTTNVYWV